MVDEGRVTRLLRTLSERVARLGSAANADVRHELWLDGVKYLFVTAIESCVDVAQHIASSDGFGAPDSNADAVRSLGAHGVIDPRLAEKLAHAVGFRNVLVHQYIDVDDDVVVAALGRLDEFERFVAEVSAWLLDQAE